MLQSEGMRVKAGCQIGNQGRLPERLTCTALLACDLLSTGHLASGMMSRSGRRGLGMRAVMASSWARARVSCV